MSDSQKNTEEYKEITFGEFVEDVKNVLLLLKRKWLVLLVFGLIFGALMGFWAYRSPSVYTAKVVFMIDDDQGSSFTSTASALLGRFGFGGGGKINQNKILEISKSQNLIFEALFKKDSLLGRYDYYANFIIDLYQIKLEDKIIHFSNGDFNSFNLQERQILKSIYQKLVDENGMLVTDFNEDSGIMYQSLTTLNDTLSVNLLSQIYASLSDFYISRSIRKEQKNYNELKQKSDSLYTVLNKQEATRRFLNDKSLGLYLETDRLSSHIQDRDSRISLMMYGEILKNLEISSFALKTKTPLITVVDEPFVPLKPKKKSILIYSAAGLAMGLILSGFYTIISDKIKKVQNKA